MVNIREKKVPIIIKGSTYNYDVVEREENIHYAMLQSDSPEKVILISGSLNSHLPEILKYPVKEIIYIERDPALAETWSLPTDTLPVKLLSCKQRCIQIYQEIRRTG